MHHLVGDAGKARAKLDREQTEGFADLVTMMVRADVAEREALPA